MIFKARICTVLVKLEKTILGISLLLLATGTMSPARAISPEDRCEANKNKIAGKYAFCRLRAEARAIARGETPDYSKCDDKLLDRWATVEQRAINRGAACIDSVPSMAIQSYLTTQTDAVAAALDGGTLGCLLPATGETTAYGSGSDGDVKAGAALSYTDNGDGTITDNNTGLMWEKKDDSGGIHDKDNVYTWCGASCGTTNELDGTVKTVFLDTLNDVAGGGTSCFAGYCDWRTPNAKELQSIVAYDVFYPSVDPAFHQLGTCTGCMDVTAPTCSCTSDSFFYWSSTSFALNPGFAWMVNFREGPAGFVTKTGNHQVRAVRGGS